MRRGHDGGWSRQRGPGVDHTDQERERAPDGITQPGTEGADLAGDKKGDKHRGTLGLDSQ